MKIVYSEKQENTNKFKLGDITTCESSDRLFLIIKDTRGYTFLPLDTFCIKEETVYYESLEQLSDKNIDDIIHDCELLIKN